MTSLLWVRSLVVEAFSLSIRVPLVGLGQVLTSSGGMSWTRCPFGRSPPPTVALQGAVYPSSATPRRSAGSAHVSRKGRQPGPARPRQSPPTPTSPTRPPHTSAVLRVLHQIRQRLPNDHLVIRIVFPAPGMPADRRRPTRTTMLGRLRVPVRRAPPTAGRRDTTMRRSRTDVLDSCLT